MANTKISIDALSETVMKELNEYADVDTDIQQFNFHQNASFREPNSRERRVSVRA